jgi:hypothetical protein
MRQFCTVSPPTFNRWLEIRVSVAQGFPCIRRSVFATFAPSLRFLRQPRPNDVSPSMCRPHKHGLPPLLHVLRALDGHAWAHNAGHSHPQNGASATEAYGASA